VPGYAELDGLLVTQTQVMVRSLHPSHVPQAYAHLERFAGQLRGIN
jgi:hypothetical protein